MEDAKSSLPKAAQSKLTDSEREKKLFFNSLWLGVRQEAELPVKAGSLKGKSLVPELLDRSFLVADDYHHYDDWKVLLEETYDQFNLLQVSPTAS